ncbi:MAG: LysR substrate-binding domain-containing protein [Hyphomicrobiales bacterium]
MLPNLDVDQLKTFLAIADAGSFTRAAEDVNKTQSAVSMQMKRLEESLGRSLFLREGRGNRLTEEGERFIGLARRMVGLNDEIVSSYASPALSGTVRFGTPDDYADLFLPEVLARFARSHPQVTVDVECFPSVNLKEKIKGGQLDLALVTFGSDSVGEVLRRERLVWVTSTRHRQHLNEVLPLATADLTCGWRQRATMALDSVGRSYRIGYTSPNRNALDAVVQQGLAVAAMAEICVRPGMRVLSESEGFPDLGSIGIGLLRKSGSITPAAEALARHVRDSFGDGVVPAVVAA